MRSELNIFYVAVLLALAGCSGSAKREMPAPVEEVRLQAPSESNRKAAATPSRARIRAEKPPVRGPNNIEVIAYKAPVPVSIEPSSAVMQLVQQSRLQHQRGDLDQAVNSLERALRIEPRNPHLWNRLALVRLDQRRFQMASHLAAKSNALAGNNPGLKRENWLIIAESRRQSGDAGGAQAAEKKADAAMK